MTLIKISFICFLLLVHIIEDVKTCIPSKKSIDGCYTEYSSWSSCSKSCGGGIRERTRTCTNPPPSNGGRDCTGEPKQQEACNTGCCPTLWSSWGDCTVTCGQGTKTRMRHSETCTIVKDVTNCSLNACPIDGGYTEYSRWSSCSKSCGGGIRERTRTCTNPTPRHGGKDCITLGLGEPKQQEACNTGCCPVPLYRYWNLGISDHFYTTNYGELGAGKAGWKSEGIQCHIFPCHRADTVPLYRYYGNNDHFYTTNSVEIGTTVPGVIGKHGYKSEGIAGYCYPRKYGNSIPLYRYYNSVSDHFYTTSAGEIGTTQAGAVGRHGYKSEGIACFVLP